MSRAIKEMLADELKERYAGVSSVCVVDLTGLDVPAQEKLRRTLGQESARLEVVKNSLAKRAFLDGPLNPLGQALAGPCALVVGADSAVKVARTLVAAMAEIPKLKLKEAVFEGDPALLTVEVLAKMSDRRELMGEVAMLVSSPGRALAGSLRSPQAKIAGCLKKMIECAA